MHMINIGLEI